MCVNAGTSELFLSPRRDDPTSQVRQALQTLVLSAVFLFVLAHGATKPLLGWSVRINRLHHLDVCHRRLLTTSNSICETCLKFITNRAAWCKTSWHYSIMLPPLLRPFSGRSICTIAPFFRHSLFWGLCFCHSQQPDETSVSVSCHWGRRQRWSARSDTSM